MTLVNTCREHGSCMDSPLSDDRFGRDFMKFSLAWAMIVATIGVRANAQSTAGPVSVSSPDGRNMIMLEIDSSGRPVYSVARDGDEVIAPSPTSLSLEDGPIGEGARIAGSERKGVDQNWRAVAGKASLIRDHFNEAVVHLVDGKQRRFDLLLRAYDDGVALRNLVPVQPKIDGKSITGEETGFNFARNDRCWGFNVGRFRTGHEGEFDPVEARHIRDHNLYDLPLLCETGKAAFLITESDLGDYPAMYLKGRGDGGLGVVTKLSPLVGNPDLAAYGRLGEPIRTPWRVVMLGDKAGQLAQSNLVENLASPSRIEDTSWIIPGKSVSDWLAGGAVGGRVLPVSSSQSMMADIDFAAENGFPYVMVDDGWYAGSGVAPTFNPNANLFADAPNFNLRTVAAYAKKRGVKLWVWVDWRVLDPIMEQGLAYLEAQGIAGLNVDFMERDDQEMVRWYEKLVSSAARHHLMIELHGAFVPRGLARTYPNFITQEGVLGSEYNKWSRRVTAGHNVMLAYTRAMLGPMDYIPGGFVNVSPAEFQPRWVLPMVQTTRAHNLSMFVVFESPWTSLQDSPDSYRSSPAGFDFIREVPTSWDETRFVAGEVGDFIVLAKRKGDVWYLGAMNGDSARKASIPLSFLGPGAWTADLWLDGGKPDAIRREKRGVTANETIAVDLAATGGAVAVFRRP
jgi:alpha-glucosidase